MHACVCVEQCACVCVCVCVQNSVCVCVCMCMHVCVHACMCVHARRTLERECVCGTLSVCQCVCMCVCVSEVSSEFEKGGGRGGGLVLKIQSLFSQWLPGWQNSSCTVTLGSQQPHFHISFSPPQP